MKKMALVVSCWERRDWRTIDDKFHQPLDSSFMCESHCGLITRYVCQHIFVLLPCKPQWLCKMSMHCSFFELLGCYLFGTCFRPTPLASRLNP